ncbi:MAG TPA: GNAT family N-acetyltransferase [Rhodanobacteraceae bacterium]|nr:GNAT family N-acetyltransferase [Rhodanobacteraceae bacterium]
MTVLGCSSARLRLRPCTLADAPFILRLLTDPAWLRWIGDKGVATLDDARRYLHSGPLAMYAEHGFGLLRVNAVDGDEPLGVCGLLKRDYLDAPDLGFAFLPEGRGHGYATEAATAVLAQAGNVLGIARVLAITAAGNHRSEATLTRLGFQPDGQLTPPGSAIALNRFLRKLASP